MKKIFKKMYRLILPVLVIILLVYVICLAVNDHWIKLAKFSFFISFGAMLSVFEIPEAIIWRIKRIIFYDE